MKDEKPAKRTLRKLEASELRLACGAEAFDFESTDQLESLDEIIGQERAIRAIRFGLGMQSFGYNIYVSGVPGTGKKTLVRSLVEKIAETKTTPEDLFYVHNFEDPDHPSIVRVPAGVGCEFQRDMQKLMETLQEEIPKVFKSEDYEERRGQIVQSYQSRRAELIESIQETAMEKGLTVKSAGSQLMTVPVVDGEELTPEQFSQLPEEQQEEIREKQQRLSESIQEAYRQIRDVQQGTQERLKELDRTVALIATGHYLDELRGRYKEYPKIVEYLESVQSNLLDHIGDFLEDEEENQMPAIMGLASSQGDRLKKYSVNVIVDNSDQRGAPVVIESHPTYRNLIGFMEREARMGTLYTDFTMIRAGSLLEANGGYLILDMVDLLITPLAWESLKRVLQDGEVKIQDPAEQFGIVGTLGLRPEAVEVNLKVVILGSAEIYMLLYQMDEDFQKLFKIKSDFDTVMKKDEDHLHQYARFIKKICDKESLKHFKADAVCALVEHSSRMVSDKTRLTLRFSEVADLIREASYWAAQNGDSLVSREDVEKAIREKIYRSNLIEERLQEMIDENSILIATRGATVGQINGLSVYQVGDYAFGKPTRLTAQVGTGDKGVVNIEREAHLSGNIHDKGVLILSGYLHGKYGQKEPLGLYASIGFEQSYSGVDGDSASSAELYAILSSLADIPLKQNLAVTGSMNQKGLIQPIGGVNEKIEGFFETCRQDGLTGDQGVVIPHQNVQNLMLKTEVIEAVSSGDFHIYPIKTVDEGLEIMTGLPAGEQREDGSYPEESVHARVQQRLKEMSEVLRRRGPGENDGSEETAT